MFFGLIRNIAACLKASRRVFYQPQYGSRHLGVELLEQRQLLTADFGAMGSESPPAEGEHAGVIAETLLDIDSAGNLVITDINGGSSDDSLTLFFDTENQLHVIQDPSQVLSTEIESATQVDDHTIHVPTGAFPGAILINTLGGNDSLTLDLSLGMPSRTLIFDGGEGDDSLTVERGTLTSTVDTVTHRATSAHSGAVVIDVDGPGGATAPTTVEYTNLEPISDNLNVHHRVFEFTGADETITLGVEAKVVKSPLQLYDLQSRANATTATIFENLAGNPGGPQFRNGDVIEISGTDTTGANVTGTFTVTDRTTDTLQDLLDRIEQVYDGTATAAIDNGQIELTAVTDALSPIPDVSLRLASDVDNTGNIEPDPFGVFFVAQVERSVIDSTLSESINFASPNVSLRIETSALGAGGSDTVYVEGFDPSSIADLTVATDGNDIVTFRKQPFVMRGDLSIEAQTVRSEVNWSTNGGAVSVLALDGVIDIHSVQSSADSAQSGSEGGSIDLTAVGNVTTGTLDSSGNSRGGAVTVTSTTGAIDIVSGFNSINSGASDPATSEGGGITLSASGDVTTSGSLSSFGGLLGGNISVVSTNGLISTGDLFSRAFSSSGSQGGAIVLAAHSTIDTSLVSSRGNDRGGDITITAGGDIVAENFDAFGPAAGGDISVTSDHGGIKSQPFSRLNVTTRGEEGGSISLTASRDIIVGDLLSSGTHKAGDVTVASSAGTFEVGSISSSGNSNESGSEGGAISLTAHGDVTTETLDSSGNSRGGAVTVTSTTGAIDIVSGVISINSAASDPATSEGGGITLSASGDVTTLGYLSSFGGLLGGSISVVSTNGLISTGDLFSRALSSSGSQGGAIALAAHSTIETSLVSSRGNERGGDITITAGGDIVAENFDAFGPAAGGDISVTSNHGGIKPQPFSRLNITTRGGEEVGSISLTASSDIIVGDLLSSGTHQAGDVTVASSAGTIEVGSISSSGNPNEPGSEGGAISLNAHGDITTGYMFSNGGSGGGVIIVTSTHGNIDTERVLSIAGHATAGEGGDITLSANGDVAAISLDTSGSSKGGNILVSGASFNVFSANSASGDIEFSVDAITVDDEIRGEGRLLIHPKTPGTTLGIGGGTGGLDLDDATLARLGGGFQSITLGDAQTAAVDIGGFGEADATAALRGHFKMDEGAGTATVNEVSPQGATLVNMDPLTAWVSGDLPPVVGGTSSALRFDGADDYVDTRVTPTGAAFTVAFWVKGEAQNSTQPAIVSWGAGSIPGGLFEVGVEPSTGRLTVDVGGAAAVGTANVLDGDWHQIIVRIADDGSPNVNEIDLFVDGQADQRSAADNQEVDIRTRFRFARIADTVTGERDRNFTGLLDEVRIYESALTDSELRVFFEEIDVLFHAPVSIIGEAIKVDGLDADTNEVHLTAVGGGPINDGSSGVDITGSSVILEGNVAPGASSGILVVDGDFTFAPISSFEVEIDGIAPGTEHDQLVVSGDNRVITLDGAQLNISLGTPPVIGSGQTYTIVDSTGAGSSIHGVFKDGATDLNDGDWFTVGSTGFRINYLSSGDVVLTEARNTPPTIDVSVTALSYVENAPATRNDAAIASDEQVNWDGGTLVAQITANAEASDRLSLLTVGNVTLVGNNVRVDGVTVGTTSATNVTGASAMTITFNVSADNAAVQEIVRALGFDSTSENPSTAQRTLTFTLTDSLSESSDDTLKIDVTAVNDDPTVDQGIADQTATENVAFDFSVPGDAFADVDADDTLTLSATGLPTWLTFTPATGQFTGTPHSDDVTTTPVTITVTADDGNGGTPASTTFGLTVLDVPNAVNLSVDTNNGTEEAGTVVTVTATASGSVAANETVDLTVSGSNVDAGDFTLTNMTITIAGGSDSGFVTFTVEDDHLVEALTETATLTISNPSSGLTLGTTTSQAVEIRDNDNALVTIEGQSKNEGTGVVPTTFVFSIDLSAPVDISVDMTADTIDGTATATDDFTPISGANVSFAPGTTTTQTVEVQVDADSTIEADEAFELALTALMASGRDVTFDGGLATLNATANINNDDFDIGGLPPIIDDGDTGFSTLGNWAAVNRNGRNGGFLYSAPGNGDTATWSFDVTPGRYTVAASWRDWTNRATDAPYTIFDGNIPLITVDVNQQVRASGVTDDGTDFFPLGEFQIASNRITIELSDAANGLVSADAIRVEAVGAVNPGPEIQVTAGGVAVNDNSGVVEFGQAELDSMATRIITIENVGTADLNITSPITVPAGFTLVSPPATTITPVSRTTMEIAMDTSVVGTPTGEVSFNINDADENPFNFTVQGAVVTGVRIIDNGSAGFTPFAGGTTVNRNGHQGDFQYANSGTGDTARWTFNVVPGDYVVAAAWRAHSNRAINAPYTILDGAVPLGTVPVDQTQPPVADFVEGPLQFDRFENIGTFSISGNQLVVELSDAVSGLVVADAIRIERLP